MLNYSPLSVEIQHFECKMVETLHASFDNEMILT